MSGPKESTYDAEIAPLMAQIIAICEREKISLAAMFELDRAREDTEDDFVLCSTVIEQDDAGSRIRRMCAQARPQRHFATFTVSSRRSDTP